jgi:glycosyltransferase involved in cell wall biosynthesis
MPAVSIAIRAFRRRWLAETIASVLAQTHRDLELIIYDDAGDLDDLAAATRDPRVRYHAADARRSASGRFAAAVALCRGDYLGLLDDDDAYAPDFVATLAGALDADPRAGVAFCRTTWDADGVRVVPRDPRPAGRQPDAAAAMLRDGWTVSPSHLLIRRQAYEAAMRDQAMPPGVAPDAFLNLRVALAGWAHVLVDAPLVVTRWHAGQVSRAYPVAFDTAVATWGTLHLADPVLAVLRDRRLAHALRVRAFEHLRAGAVDQARDDLRAAAGACPDRSARARGLALAAACGRAGTLAARAWSAFAPAGRRRRRPPSHVGGACS